jgi:hypothetical protein
LLRTGERDVGTENGCGEREGEDVKVVICNSSDDCCQVVFFLEGQKPG